MYELQVMAICSQLKYMDAWSLEDTNTERIARNINNDIAKLPRRSVGSPEMFYKAEVESNIRVVVNHLDIHGEVDRVIAEIDYEK